MRYLGLNFSNVYINTRVVQAPLALRGMRSVWKIELYLSGCALSHDMAAKLLAFKGF